FERARSTPRITISPAAGRAGRCCLFADLRTNVRMGVSFRVAACDAALLNATMASRVCAKEAPIFCAITHGVPPPPARGAAFRLVQRRKGNLSAIGAQQPQRSGGQGLFCSARN